MKTLIATTFLLLLSIGFSGVGVDAKEPAKGKGFKEVVQHAFSDDEEARDEAHKKLRTYDRKGVASYIGSAMRNKKYLVPAARTALAVYSPGHWKSISKLLDGEHHQIAVDYAIAVRDKKAVSDIFKRWVSMAKEHTKAAKESAKAKKDEESEEDESEVESKEETQLIRFEYLSNALTSAPLTARMIGKVESYVKNEHLSDYAKKIVEAQLDVKYASKSIKKDLKTAKSLWAKQAKDVTTSGMTLMDLECEFFKSDVTPVGMNYRIGKLGRLTQLYLPSQAEEGHWIVSARFWVPKKGDGFSVGLAYGKKSWWAIEVKGDRFDMASASAAGYNFPCKRGEWNTVAFSWMDKSGTDSIYREASISVNGDPFVMKTPVRGAVKGLGFRGGSTGGVAGAINLEERRPDNE